MMLARIAFSTSPCISFWREAAKVPAVSIA
jgi:hypothetical protein